MKIFSIHDSKAEAYLPPFYCRAEGEAIRNFQTAINTQDHAFNAHAADYTLFYLGDWDETSATFSLKKSIENLGNGMNYLDKD